MRRQRTTAQVPSQPPDKGRTYHQRSCAAPTNRDSFEFGGRLQTRRTKGKTVDAVEDEDSFESNKVYLPMRIARKNFEALPDTGCEITVIPAKLVRRRQLQYTTRTLIAANGTQIPIAGSTTIKAFVGRSPVIISGLVSEHVTEVMLGFDWLKENEVQWDFVRGEVTIQGEVYKLAARRTRGTWCRRVVAAHDVTVPPRSQFDVPT